MQLSYAVLLKADDIIFDELELLPNGLRFVNG